MKKLKLKSLTPDQKIELLEEVKEMMPGFMCHAMREVLGRTYNLDGVWSLSVLMPELFANGPKVTFGSAWFHPEVYQERMDILDKTIADIRAGTWRTDEPAITRRKSAAKRKPRRKDQPAGTKPTKTPRTASAPCSRSFSNR